MARQRDLAFDLGCMADLVAVCRHRLQPVLSCLQFVATGCVEGTQQVIVV